MFAKSTQHQHWMYGSVNELDRLRGEANQAYVDRHRSRTDLPDDQIFKYFLTFDEEKDLQLFYQNVLKEFCKSFQPPMPRTVVGTAFQYYKRFYLNNSVMDFHPKMILVTCVYMACKVEEFNVSMSQFVANVKGDRGKAMDVILNNELLLMKHLKYHLTVHNPYRPIEGFLIDLKTRCLTAGDPERFRKDIDDNIDRSYFTDACLLFSPSQISLAAICFAAATNDADIDTYVTSILLGEDSEKVQLFMNMREYFWQLIRTIPDIPGKNRVKELESKLDKCRNAIFNPDSQEYKKALQEELEAEDDEPSRKIPKLSDD